jgi:hypothetical protein
MESYGLGEGPISHVCIFNIGQDINTYMLLHPGTSLPSPRCHPGTIPANTQHPGTTPAPPLLTTSHPGGIPAHPCNIPVLARTLRKGAVQHIERVYPNLVTITYLDCSTLSAIFANSCQPYAIFYDISPLINVVSIYQIVTLARSPVPSS